MSDFYEMSAMMKELFPSNPEADKKALMSMAGKTAPVETPVVVQESAEVQQGSLQMDKDYSVNDFAALAGVTTATPRVAQPVMESMPIINKDDRIAQLEERVAKLESLLSERSLTKGEENKKEKIVKGMKKNKDDFKKRYGKDAEAVMYATATKNAKKESFIKDELYRRLAEYEFKSAKK